MGGELDLRVQQPPDGSGLLACLPGQGPFPIATLRKILCAVDAAESVVAWKGSRTALLATRPFTILTCVQFQLSVSIRWRLIYNRTYIT